MNCPLCESCLPLTAAETYECKCNSKLDTFRCIPQMGYWIWINTPKGCIEFSYDSEKLQWDISTRIEDGKGILINSQRVASGKGFTLTKDAATILKRYQKLLAFL